MAAIAWIADASHPRAMRCIAILAVMLAGCAAQVPAPALCDMPPGFRGWQGAQVSWTGVVIGGAPHGYVLACEQHVGGVRIDTSDDTIGGRAFEQALDEASVRNGSLRVTVEGRLRRSYGPDQFGLTQDRPVLRISAVRSIDFTPMTAAEFEAFLERR